MTGETGVERDLSEHVDRFGKIKVDITIGGGPGAAAEPRSTGVSASPVMVAGFLRELAGHIEQAGKGPRG